MIEIVMLPLVWTWSREAAFMAERQGQLTKIQDERRRELETAKDDLAGHLANGYRLLASHLMEADQRTYIVYTLHKAKDGEDAQHSGEGYPGTGGAQFEAKRG